MADASGSFESLGIAIPKILLPASGTDLAKWTVVACDQFTSQPDYWQAADEKVGDAPSTLRLMLPELYLDQDHHHYELDDKDEHSHLVCLSCGRVVEVDSTPFAEAALRVGENHGFEIASAQVELAGYCARCRDSGQE